MKIFRGFRLQMQCIVMRLGLKQNDKNFSVFIHQHCGRPSHAPREKFAKRRQGLRVFRGRSCVHAGARCVTARHHLMSDTLLARAVTLPWRRGRQSRNSLFSNEVIPIREHARSPEDRDVSHSATHMSPSHKTHDLSNIWFHLRRPRDAGPSPRYYVSYCPHTSSR